jgi:hypothetical protein
VTGNQCWRNAGFIPLSSSCGLAVKPSDLVHSENHQAEPGTFRIFKALSHGPESPLIKFRSVHVLCVAHQCVSEDLTVRFVVICEAGIQLKVYALKCGILLFDRALICGWYPN